MAKYQERFSGNHRFHQIPEEKNGSRQGKGLGLLDDFWPKIHENKLVEFSRLTKVGFDFTTSFFNLLVFLVDVPLGNVSAYLPGIHKPNFECPDHITSQWSCSKRNLIVFLLKTSPKLMYGV